MNPKLPPQKSLSLEIPKLPEKCSNKKPVLGYNFFDDDNWCGIDNAIIGLFQKLHVLAEGHPGLQDMIINISLSHRDCEEDEGLVEEAKSQEANDSGKTDEITAEEEVEEGAEENPVEATAEEPQSETPANHGDGGGDKVGLRAPAIEEPKGVFGQRYSNVTPGFELQGLLQTRKQLLRQAFFYAIRKTRP